MLSFKMVRCARLVTPALACWLFGAAVLAVAPKAKAWGDDGHRVVGEIAWRYLTPAAQAAVSESLTDPGYASLAEAATWPDTFAKRDPTYDPMRGFHWVNVDATAAQYRRERDCASGCVVTALAQFVWLLESSDPPLSVSERRRSVYWIAHLMGDIHQPLHIAHPDGRGGISTLVGFFEAPDKRNAHWIWDVGLIERRPPAPAGLPAELAREQPVYRAIADELTAGLSAPRVAALQRLTSPEAIADEGLLLARRAAFLKASDHVDAAYEKRSWPIVVEQLQKAGLRLAAVLNRALSAKAPPAIR
jgi:hypothetical protein